MGIKGKQSRRGEGEKEPDGSVRDSLLKVMLPLWKLTRIKEIAALRKISLTDLINRMIDTFLSNNAEDLTQQNNDKDEG